MAVFHVLVTIHLWEVLASIHWPMFCNGAPLTCRGVTFQVFSLVLLVCLLLVPGGVFFSTEAASL